MLCSLLSIVVVMSVGSVHSENTCHACNCQFDDVQVLTGLIESIVNNTLFSGNFVNNSTLFSGLIDNFVINSLRRQLGKLIILFLSLWIADKGILLSIQLLGHQLI